MSKLTFSPQVIAQALEKFKATLSPELMVAFNGRLERGLGIAQNGGVAKHATNGRDSGTNLYDVDSSDPSKPTYLVDLHARSCTCPDHWKGHFCKHRIAASIINIAIQVSKNGKPVTSEKAYPVPPPITPRPSTPAQPPSPLAPKDAVIWGVIHLNGELLGVEVQEISGEQATIRALPEIIDGKKLRPRFPFGGERNTTTVPMKDLFHVRVFQHASA